MAKGSSRPIASIYRDILQNIYHPSIEWEFEFFLCLFFAIFNGDFPFDLSHSDLEISVFFFIRI